MAPQDHWAVWKKHQNTGWIFKDYWYHDQEPHCPGSHWYQQDGISDCRNLGCTLGTIAILHQAYNPHMYEPNKTTHELHPVGRALKGRSAVSPVSTRRTWWEKCYVKIMSYICKNFMKWQRGSYLRLSAWSRERIFGVTFLCKRDIKRDIFLAEFWHKFFWCFQRQNRWHYKQSRQTKQDSTKQRTRQH